MDTRRLIELVENLLAEAAREVALVQRAALEAEKAQAQATRRQAIHNASDAQGSYRLQIERGWLEKAYHALTVAHHAFEKLAHLEQQREKPTRWV